MKSAKFDHQRTASLDDALAALGGADGEARIMGGGQSLGPMMNLRLAQPALRSAERRGGEGGGARGSRHTTKL